MSRIASATRRTPSQAIRLVAGIAIAGLFASAPAQIRTSVDGSTPPAIAPGRPDGSLALSGFESVNLYSGKLSFNLPLLTVGARGQARHTVLLPIESHWIVEQNRDNGAYTNVAIPATDLYTPPFIPGRMTAREVGNGTLNTCPSITGPLWPDATLTRLTFTEPDGTQHEFVDAKTGGGLGSVTVCSFTGQDRGSVWVTRDTWNSTFVLDAGITAADTPSLGSPTSEYVPQITLTGVLYRPDGSRYRIVNGKVMQIQDRNGNYLSFTYETDTSSTSYGQLTKITDSIGRATTFKYSDAADANGTALTEIDYPAYAGVGNHALKIHYCALDPSDTTLPGPTPKTCAHYNTHPTAQTQSALFGMNGSTTTTFNPTVVSYIELPDGRTYEFQYNAYGELTHVSLPTGGAYGYNYAAGDNSGGNGVIGQQTSNLQIYRRVSERAIYADGTKVEGRTKYIPSYSTSCGMSACMTVEVQHIGISATGSEDLLAKEKHYFRGAPNDPQFYFFDGSLYPDWREGREYQTDSIQPNGSADIVLTRDENTWEQRTCSGTEVCPAHTTQPPRFASPIDVRLRQTDRTLVDTGQKATTVYLYDPYNNINEQDEYDYGGAFVRKRVTSYLYSQQLAGVLYDYAGIPMATNGTGVDRSKPIVHLRTLPQQQSTHRATSSTSWIEEARTTYEYDDYTSGGPYHAAVVTRPSTVQLDTTIPNARGNATKVSRWLTPSSASSTIDTYQQYDQAGNVVSIFDGRGKQTSIVFSDAYQNAWPTKVTDALQHSVSTTYDFSTGKATSFTDQNSQTTNYGYETGVTTLDRLKSVTDALQGRTSIDYDDTVNQNAVTTSRSQDSCVAAGGHNSIVSDVVYDGLGREVFTHLYEDAGKSTSVATHTQYDGLSRIKVKSDPYRGAEGCGAALSYDALNRTIEEKTCDGASFRHLYYGSTRYDLDPAGKWRKSVFDALGRLVSVTEDPRLLADSTNPFNSQNLTNPGGADLLTSYEYNSLDSLTKVTQGSQAARLFTYDGLGRLITATNPENGVICYGTYNTSGTCVPGYDGNGNLTSRTDARLVVTSMAYDDINRLTLKSYTGGRIATPAVTYCYDGKIADTADGTCKSPQTAIPNAVGLLTQMRTSAATTTYTNYDALGHVTGLTQTVGGLDYPFQYTYDLAGGISKLTYPSGRVVSYCSDSAGRVGDVSALAPGAATARTYATGVSGGFIAYAPHGEIASMKLGANFETRTYNRLQLTRVNLGSTNGLGDRWTVINDYGTSNNNGNLQSHEIAIPGAVDSAKQYFRYDALNRLQMAVEYRGTSTAPVCPDPSSQWCEQYSYDQWGNRTVAARSVLGPGDTEPPAFDSANHVTGTGWEYDGGNVVRTPAATYAYDAENRLAAYCPQDTVSANCTTTVSNGRSVYSYDGEGRRVLSQGATTTVYIYDGSGALAARYGSLESGQPSGPVYLTTDHLGSTRVVAGTDGAVLTRRDYTPFGNEIPKVGSGWRVPFTEYGFQDSIRQRFTGKERDSETGLDYSVVRYYASAQGRFTSPDEPFADQDVVNPQSWNLYSYVRNNPLRAIDPSGRCSEAAGGGYTDEGSGLFPGKCSEGTIGDSNNNTNSVTVGVGMQEAYLIMLQGVGENLSSSHQWAEVVSNGGQGAMMAMSLRNLPSAMKGGWQALRTWWVGEELIQLGIAGSNGGVLAGARFAQKTASAVFSSTGRFAGRSVEEVANALRAGTLHPSDVPIEYIVRDGNTLILNTRSAIALERAGIARSSWSAVNVTGDAAAEARLTGQLGRNGLTSAGTDTVRMK